MTPKQVTNWLRAIRDGVILFLGAFMLIFETVVRYPSPLIVGAGLTLIGIPPVLRLDEYRESRYKETRGDD